MPEPLLRHWRRTPVASDHPIVMVRIDRVLIGSRAVNEERVSEMERELLDGRELRPVAAFFDRGALPPRRRLAPASRSRARGTTRRLKLLPSVAKECRKYGISLILASQEARDFDPSLYSAIANYLVLRLTEQDAKTLAKNIAASDIQRQTADRLKLLKKYHALFFGESKRKPTAIALAL